uniref:Uncharacterized protein n=1 Tax=Leersia perrieri TaxID=77586 RepID=A0A0D9XEN5_9ORYZ
MAPPQKEQQHYLVVAPGPHEPGPSPRGPPGPCDWAHVTLSTAVSAHRRMFPSLSAPNEDVIAGDGDVGGISYFPYSDGYDEGFCLFAGDSDAAWRNLESFDRVGRETFAAVFDRLAACGRPPVTCVVYTFVMWWAADLAREKGIPRAMYWIQPAAMLAVYYGYLHAGGNVQRLVADHADEPEFEVAMPGLPPMAIRDLPSFFTDLTDRRLAAVFYGVRRTLEQVETDRPIGEITAREKPMVLVNTTEELEADVIAAVFPDLHVIPIGPAVGDGNAAAPSKKSNDMYEHDEKAYMEWLDEKPAGSVVYVSFGSMSTTSKRQKEEIRRAPLPLGRSP